MARYMEALTVERGGFRIKVPESWWEFDVRPESRDDSIHHMVTERLRAHPELAPHRDTYISFLRKAGADAWKSGTLYCGCMAETFGGDTPITGSVTVSGAIPNAATTPAKGSTSTVTIRSIRERDGSAPGFCARIAPSSSSMICLAFSTADSLAESPIASNRFLPHRDTVRRSRLS